MAPTTFDSSNPVFHLLQQTMHLSEEQRQEFWDQAASTLPTNAFATGQSSTVYQTPRSMPSTFNMTHLPVRNTLWSTLSPSNVI
jgi:hypothetical protein